MRMTHVSLVSAKTEGGYAFLRPVPLLQISLLIIAVVVSMGHEHLNYCYIFIGSLYSLCKWVNSHKLTV